MPVSAGTLRASLVLTNLAVATLLVVGLERWGGLRPLHALTAALFFAFAQPYTAALLVQANGANIEPFLFVLLLWTVRGWPLRFGARGGEHPGDIVSGRGERSRWLPSDIRSSILRFVHRLKPTSCHG